MDFNEYMAFVRKCKEEPIKELNESDFGDLEKTMGAELPAEFKSFYLKSNGEVENEYYSFSPIRYGFSIEKHIYVYAAQGISFGKKIPFATDIHGHTYLLSLENVSYGQVLFLQHEYEDEQEYDFVANNFTDFLNEFVSKNKTFLQ